MLFQNLEIFRAHADEPIPCKTGQGNVGIVNHDDLEPGIHQHDRHRVLVDNNIRPQFEESNLVHLLLQFLLAPALFGHLVIDKKQVGNLIFGVQDGHNILLKDVGAAGKFNRNFPECTVFLLDCDPCAFSFLFEDLYLPEAHADNAVTGNAAHRRIGCICLDDHKTRIGHQHGDRVLLDDRVGSTVQFGDLIHLPPVLGDIVVNDKDAGHVTAVVLDRNTILLQAFYTVGKLYKDFSCRPSLLLDHLF